MKIHFGNHSLDDFHILFLYAGSGKNFEPTAGFEKFLEGVWENLLGNIKSYGARTGTSASYEPTEFAELGLVSEALPPQMRQCPRGIFSRR